MRDIEIQQASAGAAEELAAVYRNAYQENRELGFPAKAESATAQTVTEWIRDNTVLVALVEGRVIGGVRLEATATDRIKLSRLCVHEDWKGEGVGSKLLDIAEERAADSGVDSIWLTTPEQHPYLPSLYRDRGYEATEPYPLEYRDYDEVVMEKSLS
ncbi:GNAT family N-acetyltransferase [Rhizobium sp. S152]|uniref:GNAT family N-acetyltransferase n=2 Tax=cellular organisms TaxID=131567 RepID=A0ABD5W8Z7_9EURY|nr:MULTISPECIES: GNAT family N-acetyltransferase [Bacteria]MDM9626096.1 GNAT family N-acetyltransferase [Rhizobium sp. S152]